ncbi:DUF3164 family protein [Methylobacter sp.]|uniref:DUF3164 family protein n=1 Tax=Methylobacter sp. TaxID=2051955 RepID=UPI002489F257|nr:DUF3164 family protein [Methylobacter sp.]MDI1278057.1 DUF3164 family protein [Methylobacter sp.]
MTTETLIDPSQLTEQQLEDLLRTKRNKTVQDRKAYKDLVQTTVPDAVAKLMTVSEALSGIKSDTFAYFKDLLKMKADVYGVTDNQQSHTFSTDKYGITIGYRVNDGWDDTVSAGIQKVTAYIDSLATDPSSAKLVKTIFRLLKKDAKGNLRASRVLELQKMTDDFHDVNFTDGVNTILQAYKPTRTCWFVEAYFMNEANEKVAIPLSMSSVDFPEGFEFEFLTAETEGEI